jgi:hypothetical protein
VHLEASLPPASWNMIRLETFYKDGNSL